MRLSWAVTIGVSLASETNRSKAFGPSTSGEILGLNYDTLAWTLDRFWNIIISHAVCQEKKKSALIKLKPET